MNNETTALAPSSAVVSVSSTLALLKTRLETAVANLKTAAPGRSRMAASGEVGAALDAIRTAIDGDDGLKARPALAKLSSDIGGFSNMALNAEGRAKFSTEVIEILRNEINKGGKRRRRGKTLRRRKQRKTRRRGFRGGANEALAQIADDLDNQIPAITNAFGTNLKMEYTPTVAPEVIAAALAAVPVAEAPSGLFGRLRKAVSSKTPEEKVREFLEELSTNGSYTFSDIVEPGSMSEHLRTLSA
jgi:metal-dependent amidase/aminoacylase/carboxypeptidase family protein